MKYALDANVASALMRTNQSVVKRWRRVSPGDVLVPQPVLAEIAYGIERLPKSRGRSALRDRFDRLKAELGRMGWTDSVTKTFAAIKADLERRGTPIEDFDAAIAAHALAYGATLVTSNTSHMSRVHGLRLEDWSRPDES